MNLISERIFFTRLVDVGIMDQVPVAVIGYGDRQPPSVLDFWGIDNLTCQL